MNLAVVLSRSRGARATLAKWLPSNTSSSSCEDPFLLTSSFVLERPQHLSETFGTLGDKNGSFVRQIVHPAAIFTLWGRAAPKPSQLSSMPNTGSLLRATREFGVGFLSPPTPCPFRRSPASFLGEAWVWLWHPGAELLLLGLSCAGGEERWVPRQGRCCASLCCGCFSLHF